MRDDEETISGIGGVAASAKAIANGESRASSNEPTDYPELATVERRHYAIRGEIAKGGMGRVLDARDLRLGRAVAIKELLPKHRDAARRFEREARITARLQHPAIIHVYEAGTWPGGEPFYAMTKVTGRSLAQVVAERQTLVERLGLLPNVIAVVDALAYAHSQDVIHRDLKPANVLVGGFGETVVIDWGLAKDLAAPADPAASLEMRVRPAEQTLSGSIVGTPAYMAPEQARGEPVDHRADVYALGALLYKVLSGSPPYRAATSNEVVEQVLAGPPIPVEEREPGVPPDLVAIVKKAMARDLADRYPTAAELAEDLKRFETGQLVAARHYTRRQLVERWISRHRVSLAISTIAVVVLAVFATLSFVRILDARDRAEAEREKAAGRRIALLEERGRAELGAGRAGPALANLAGAVRDKPTGALAFLLAEAMRPFEALIATLPAGTGDVRVAYRPDGTELATVSDAGTITTWDASGHRVREIARGVGRVRAVVWSADGKLAAGCGDNVIRVWSSDGALLVEFRGHEGAINDISFSPDGTRLVSASADQTAWLWTLATKSGVPLMQYESPATVAQFSPDNELVLTASERGSVDVCCYFQQPSPLRAHNAAVRVARWSPSGDRVVTTSEDGTARIWDPKSGKVVVLAIRHRGDAPIDDVAWSSDGTRLLTAGHDHVARLWAIPESPEPGELPAPAREIAQMPHADRVIRVRFSVDDNVIVTVGDDRTARVWNAKGQPIATFEHGDAVTSAELSRDGTSVVTGCRDGNARIWDVKHGLARTSRDLGSPIHAIAVAGDGRIAAGAEDRVWVLQPDGVTRVLEGHLGRVLALAFSPDGKQLASAGEDSSVFVWTGEKPDRFAVGATPVRAVALLRDGLIAGDANGVLWIWRHGSIQQIDLDPRHVTPINAIAVHEPAIAIGTDAGVYVVATSGERIVDPVPDAPPIRALAFDRHGEQLVIGGREVTVARFAMRKLSPILTLEGATGDLTSVALSDDGALVFTGGADRVMRVWDAAKGKLLATRDTGSPIEALALAQQDQLLWTGNTDGVARALDVSVLHDPTLLAGFIARNVPWRLADDDVVHPAR